MNYARTLAIIGILIIIASQVLPLWNQNEVLTWSSSQGTETAGRYLVEGRVTPPIKSGSSIAVTLTTANPGSAAVLVFPATSSGDIGPSVLSEVLQTGERSARWSIVAPQDSNYLLVVASWNTTYSLTVESSWAPYHETAIVFPVGFAITFVGILIEYYQRTIVAERAKLGRSTEPAQKRRSGAKRKER